MCGGYITLSKRKVSNNMDKRKHFKIDRAITALRKEIACNSATADSECASHEYDCKNCPFDVDRKELLEAMETALDVLLNS